MILSRILEGGSEWLRGARSGSLPIIEIEAHWNRYEITIIIRVSSRKMHKQISQKDSRRTAGPPSAQSMCFRVNRLALATCTCKLSSIFSHMRFFNVSSLPAASSCKLCKRHSTCVYIAVKCITVIGGSGRCDCYGMHLRWSAQPLSKQ